MIDFFFDFETRSRVDLRKVGAIRYATDPSTEATLITWAFGTGPVKAWRYGQPFPAELKDVATNPEKHKFIAHNVLFDYLIWTQVFSRLHPIKRPPISNIVDSMALTNHFGAGASLDGAAKVLKMPYSKDPEGRRIMLKQCKPNAKGVFPELSAEEWHKFEHYGVIDTALMRDIYYKIPQLPPAERFAWEWTLRRNLTGIKMDMPLLTIMKDIIQSEIPKLTSEFKHLTGYQFEIGSNVKLLPWLQKYFPNMFDLQAGTIEETLATDTIAPPFARRVLEIKQMAGSASVKKVATAFEREVNGRMYELLKYHEAHTKRWAGMGIQIQNFPRAGKIDGINFDQRDITDEVKGAYFFQNDGVQFVKNLLRRIWLPDDGLTMYCGDFSKIEPTVLFWLLDMGPIPKLWYEEMAAEIYGVPVSHIGGESEERQLGKATNLGSGYGMGWRKFMMQTKVQFGLVIQAELANRAINAYRSKYWKVPQLWEELSYAFEAATYGRTTSLCRGKLVVEPMTVTKGVKIRLPSGSYLYYHDAVATSEGLMFQKAKGGAAFDKHTYGGLLTEHVVSATARDIMVFAMYNLSMAGFDILNTVHDELWAQAPAGLDEKFESTMIIRPPWCPDMDISVGAKNGVRYLK